MTITQVVCVEEGGYYLYLTLNNEADETFGVNLWQENKKQKELYSVDRKTLSEAAVALFTVCSSGCDAVQGQVRIEVDAPDAPANVEWAVRIETIQKTAQRGCSQLYPVCPTSA